MTVPATPPLLAVLARREPLLSRLSAGSATKSELAASLDCSRSTIDRGIDELHERDLVEQTGRAYRTTLAGELASEEFARFARRIEGLVHARALLETFPADAALDPVLFDDADVLLPDRFDREGTARFFDHRLPDAESIRIFDAGWTPSLIESCRTAIADGTEAKVAVAEATLDRLLATNRDAVADALATGRLDLRVADPALPYTLSILRTPSEAVATVGITDGGRPAGAVVTAEEDAVDWARAMLDDVWSETSSLALGGE